MKLLKSKKTLLLGLASIIVVIGLAGGCASTSLPPRITAQQRTLLQKTRLNVTVGVEGYKFPVYSEKLTRALGETHLFSRVDHLANFTTPPDLVARVEQSIHGTATIPILTGLSLGILPTTVSETHGYSFSLRRPGIGAPPLPIRFSYSGPTTLGWWAVVLNLLPNRTMSDVYNHPRFMEAFASEIVTQRDAIESLRTQ